MQMLHAVGVFRMFIMILCTVVNIIPVKQFSSSDPSRQSLIKSQT